MSKIYLKGIATKADDGTYRVIASTAAVDRQGDIIQQGGWDLKNFLKNPVVLWAHQYDELPVGKATDIKVTSQGLEMAFVFAPAEANAKAEQVRNCFEGGYLNAVSVGFIPLERNGNIITRAELLEVSIVPVPANQEALRLAMSKGLSIDKIASDIEKGEVADQVEAQKNTKWGKWCEFTDIISAFWTVYFDESTPTEDFSKLLNEVIILLGQLSQNDGADDEVKSAVEKFLNGKTIKEAEAATAWLTKAGRTISEKNAKTIKAAVEHLRTHIKSLTDATAGVESHCTALDEMLKSSSSSDTGSGENAKDVQPSPMSKEDLSLLRTQLRASDRQNEVALAMVNRFLGTKEIK
jgi:uncharacterized protein